MWPLRQRRGIYVWTYSCPLDDIITQSYAFGARERVALCLCPFQLPGLCIIYSLSDLWVNQLGCVKGYRPAVRMAGG